MSRLQSTRRRLSLLAGSSLVAASLGAGVGLVSALAPAVAAAQACTPTTPPPGSEAGTDAYNCAGDFPAGIVLNSSGDLIANYLTNGGDIGGLGIDLNGSGDDDVFFNSAVEIDGNGLTGALVDVSSDTGDISVSSATLDADQSNAAAMDYGLRAVSDSGDINVTLNGAIDADANGANLDGVAGIYAATGGAGSVAISTGAPGFNSAAIEGRLYGILAETEAGDITISTGGQNGSTAGRESGIRAVTSDGGNIEIASGLWTQALYMSGSAPDSIGIEARALGGGDISITNINAAGQQGRIGGNAYGILAEASGSGNVTIVLAEMNSGSAAEAENEDGVAVRAIVQNGEIIFENNATIVHGAHFSAAAGGSSLLTNNLDLSGTVIIDGAGAATIDNNGLMGIRLSAAEHTGALTLENYDGAEWRFADEGHVLGSGSDLIHNRAGALIATSILPDDDLGIVVRETELDFGGGADRFLNEGRLLVGETTIIGGGFRATHANAAETRFLNLGTFENAGLIVFGGILPQRFDVGGVAPDASNGQAGSVLAMPGATFTGLEGSRMVMDVFLSGPAQTNCTDRDEEGFLPSGDCLVLTGGATAGVTEIFLNQIIPGNQAGYNPDGIVIVDVAGGESAAEHFFISPESAGYDPANGGISKGFFSYRLLYDTEEQQHKLVGLIGDNGLQLPLLVQTALSTTRGAGDALFDRQADLRDAGDELERGRRLWARASYDLGERELVTSTTSASQTVVFDNSFEQETSLLTMGVDWLLGGGGQVWTLGGAIGYGRSKLQFDASDNVVDLDGLHLAAYGGYAAGPYFANAAVTGAWLKVDDDAPSAGLNRADAVLSTDARTLGAQAEIGLSFELTEALRLEPLASVSWVRADLSEIELPSGNVLQPSNTIAFDDSASLRAGLGGRLALNTAAAGLRVQYGATARYWNELDGETRVVIDNSGPDAVVTDTFDGGFTDLSASVSVLNPSGAASGFLSVDTTIADQYDSLGVSAGFRYQW